MNALAVLVAGYCMSILVGRLRIEARWVKDAVVILMTLVQVALVVMILFSKDPPSLQRP
jgi:hypothetical protein